MWVYNVLNGGGVPRFDNRSLSWATSTSDFVMVQSGLGLIQVCLDAGWGQSGLWHSESQNDFIGLYWEIYFVQMLI